MVTNGVVMRTDRIVRRFVDRDDNELAGRPVDRRGTQAGSMATLDLCYRFGRRRVCFCRKERASDHSCCSVNHTSQAIPSKLQA